MSELPSPSLGQIALGHWRASCAGLRPSCARSVSISHSRRKKAGHAPAPSPSRQSGPPQRQKSRGKNRPHRPRRPPIREKPTPATASRLDPRGPKTAMRTQTRAVRTVATKATIRPPALTPWKTTPWTLRTVRTRISRPNLHRGKPGRRAGVRGYEGSRGSHATLVSNSAATTWC